MNNTDAGVLRSAQDWLTQGHRVILGTVVRTWGSAPRPVGSLMVIRDDGVVAGSISGGCIEDDLIGRVARSELGHLLPEITSYGNSAEDSHRFGLPCGGTVQVVLEPLSSGSRLDALLAGLERHQLVRRQLNMTTGAVHLQEAHANDILQFDGETLTTVHGPHLRLLIIGGGQLSICLATMASMMDYHVTVCEPRVEYHDGWSAMPSVHLSSLMPDDVVTAMQLDSHSAVVALTHDPKLDDLGLMEALRTNAFYVGALGSRHNNTVRRKRLLEFDLSPSQTAQLRGPIGLRIGSLTPAEIALSVLAEMTALRRGIALDAPLNNWSQSGTLCSL